MVAHSKGHNGCGFGSSHVRNAYVVVHETGQNDRETARGEHKRQHHFPEHPTYISVAFSRTAVHQTFEPRTPHGASFCKGSGPSILWRPTSTLIFSQDTPGTESQRLHFCLLYLSLPPTFVFARREYWHYRVWYLLLWYTKSKPTSAKTEPGSQSNASNTVWESPTLGAPPLPLPPEGKSLEKTPGVP